jgi:hypothetical protein
MNRPLVSLTASIALLLSACITSTPGVVRTSTDNPLVSIGAGKIEVGPTAGWFVWYVIDKRTETCWMKLGDSAGAMDCCALRKVPEAVPVITWESDATCSGRAAPPASASP